MPTGSLHTSPAMWLHGPSFWLSFWLIVSRVANDSGPTVYDLAAMRYGLASRRRRCRCALYYKPWRGLRLTQTAVLVHSGPRLYPHRLFKLSLCAGGTWGDFS